MTWIFGILLSHLMRVCVCPASICLGSIFTWYFHLSDICCDAFRSLKMPIVFAPFHWQHATFHPFIPLFSTVLILLLSSKIPRCNIQTNESFYQNLCHYVWNFHSVSHKNLHCLFIIPTHHLLINIYIY